MESLTGTSKDRVKSRFDSMIKDVIFKDSPQATK